MVFNSIYSDVVVVTLKNTQVRLEQFTKEIASLGDTARVVYAQEPTPDVKNRAAAIQECCINTHRTILEDARDKKLESIMIFEDDASFENDILEYVPVVSDFLKNNSWDMFYWGVNYVRPPTKYLKNISKIQFGYSGHAYSVHSRFYDFIIELWTIGSEKFNRAKKHPFLQHLDPNIHYADTLLAASHAENNCFAVTPRLVYQRPSFSSLLNHQVDYSRYHRDPRPFL